MPSYEINKDGNLKRVDQKRDRGASWKKKRDKIIEENDLCFLCGELVDKDAVAPDPTSPSIEHLIPYSDGGSDDLDNLALSCLGCNMKRGTKPIDEVRFTPTSRVW